MRTGMICWQVFICLVLSSYFGNGLPAVANEADWVNLFNGKDLEGWDTWLRAPEDQGGKEGEPIGLNKDPLGVFTVEDGVLHISGEVYGCISSVEEFSDYQIRFDFKWGEKKWPPRLQRLRDSGFLYHCHGPHGAFWNAWKACMEYQVQEGDVGDIYPLLVPHPKSLISEKFQSDPKAVYDPEEQPRTTSWRVSHSGKHELPNGEWNTCQVIVSGDHSVHIVNGFVINRVFEMKANLDGQKKSLTSGYLQFQSEAAEVFYRNLQLRDLPAMPEADTSLLAGVKSEYSKTQVDGEPTVLVYKNSGNEPCQVPAIELIGQAADDFQCNLPAMPVVLAPGEELEIGVHFQPRDKNTHQTTVTLRLEGLDGPAEHTRIVLQGQL